MNLLLYWPKIIAALCIWREARNQTYAAMLAVAWAIKNRVRAGKDECAVVTQKWQFSGMTAPGDPNLIQWGQTNDPIVARVCMAIEAVFEGSTPDPTNGSTFYFSPPLTAPPEEWGPVTVEVTIDELTFCKAA